MHAEAELIVDCRNELGEMPLWCAGSATLFWIDVTCPGRLFHWQTRDDSVDFLEFDDLLTSVVSYANGNLLIAGSRQILELDLKTRSSRTLYELPADQATHRFNDGGCDCRG